MSTVNNKLTADRNDAQAAALDALQRGRKGQHSGLIFSDKASCDRRDLTRAIGMVTDDDFELIEEDPLAAKLLALDDAGVDTVNYVWGPDSAGNYWIDLSKQVPEEEFEDDDNVNESVMAESTVPEQDMFEECSFVDAVLNWDRYRTRYE